MAKYSRIFVIVLDSLGVGRMADSDSFGIMMWIPWDTSLRRRII